MTELRPAIIRLFEEGNSGETGFFNKTAPPSHKSEDTQNLIRDNVPEFISVDISPQRNNGEWPPNSPDLNVMDYSIWSILEAEACSKPHQSIDALKKSLVKAGTRSLKKSLIERWMTSRSDYRSVSMPEAAISRINSKIMLLLLFLVMF